MTTNFFEDWPNKILTKVISAEAPNYWKWMVLRLGPTLVDRWFCLMKNFKIMIFLFLWKIAFEKEF